MNINGFDERYRAPAWGEDIDIHYRLKLKQVNHEISPEYLY